jgi:hypothetical protein
MNKARGSLETVKNAVNFLTAKFVTALAPSIEAVSKKVATFVREHGTKLIEWIQYAIRTITRVADLINKTVQNTVGWKNALLALAIVFIALNSAIMLPVAAIALLFIALEDIAAYSRGEDSLIGRYLKGMPAFKKVFDDLLDTFNLLPTALGAIFSGDFTKLDEMTKKWGLFGDALKIVARALNIINKGLSMKSINASMEGVKEKGFFQEYLDEFGNLGEMVTNTDWLGTKTPKATEPSSVTINNNPTINVSGSLSPEDTARLIAERIGREKQMVYDRMISEKQEK